MRRAADPDLSGSCLRHQRQDGSADHVHVGRNHYSGKYGRSAADDGMPIGMQLIGKVLDEATILRAAYTFEQATEYHKVFAPLGGNK